MRQAIDKLTASQKEQAAVMEGALTKLNEAHKAQAKALEDAIGRETRAMEGIAAGLGELRKVIQTDVETGLPSR